MLITTQNVRCPNCGSLAYRHSHQSSHVIETICPECDYLMVNCALTGKVFEAYAPGIRDAKR